MYCKFSPFLKDLFLILIFVFTAIVEEPTAKEEDENPEEETRKNLAFLLEKVEGCSVCCLYLIYYVHEIQVAIGHLI